MSALIIDTETTGLIEPEAIEIAHLDVYSASLHDRSTSVFVSRYLPSKPITPSAQAIHRIFEEDLVGCPPAGSFTLPEGTEYLIGHNVDFDWEAIGKPPVKRICTLALSRWLWPSAGSHTLGAMICLLHPDRARALLKGAHSASTDVGCCALLFDSIIRQIDSMPNFEQLWELSERARRETDRNRSREPSGPATAAEILERGAKHIRDRAALRDTPAGERSMAKTVTAFNAMFGTHISERQGWQFMELLKIARSSAGGHNGDDYEDGAAYAALAGECAAQEAQ